jgi:hypothetical protein
MMLFKNRSRAARIATSLAVCLGLATPVLAGTVYSWRSEDGTISFTDDEKHVPSRYRDSAEVKQTEKLDEYERFTASENDSDGSYAERLKQRRDALQGAGTVVITPVPAGSSMSTIVGGTRYGRGGLVVPLDGTTTNSNEPVIIENRRTKPSDSMATRHETVVRQGDRVISIQRDELSHRDHTGMVPPVDD